jgi:hypothetical protein
VPLLWEKKEERTKRNFGFSFAIFSEEKKPLASAFNF